MSQTVPPEEFESLVGLFRSNRIEDATVKAAELTNTYSNDSRLWNLAAAIHGAAGRIDDALAAYSKSLALDPGNTKALNNRAVLNQRLKRFDAAREDLLAALNQNPNDPEVLNTLASIDVLTGDHRSAEAHLRRALTSAPKFVDALGNLGLVLNALGKSTEARDVLGQAIDLAPGDLRIATHYATALFDLGNYDEAVLRLRSIVEKDPANSTAWRAIGRAQEQMGDRESAQAAAEKAIELSPDDAAGYLLLSRFNSLPVDDPMISRMEEFAADHSRPKEERRALSFALGRISDTAAADPELVFHHFEAANKLQRQQFDYSVEDERMRFQQIMARPVAAQAGAGVQTSSGPTPIFILGMPRSGTTLVEQILASHSKVHGAGELEAMSDAVAQSGWLAGDPNADVETAYRSVLPNVPENTPHFTDKMPKNFQWIGAISEAFPQAPIIALRRHPMAVCWSIFTQSFARNSTLYGYDLSELGLMYRLYKELMDHWDKVLPGRIYHLDYKALTENQEDETRRLLDHVGLEFELQCLSFEKTSRTVNTASALQVRQKMYQGSSDAWRRYEEHLQPLRLALGDAVIGWE